MSFASTLTFDFAFLLCSTMASMEEYLAVLQAQGMALGVALESWHAEQREEKRLVREAEEKRLVREAEEKRLVREAELALAIEKTKQMQLSSGRQCF
jgi:hypothetical protein